MAEGYLLPLTPSCKRGRAAPCSARWARCLLLAVTLLWLWAAAGAVGGEAVMLWSASEPRRLHSIRLPWRRRAPEPLGMDPRTATMVLGLGMCCLLVVVWFQWMVATPAVQWSFRQLMWRRSKPMCGCKALQLHDDLWLQISDFVQTRALSLVCSGLWHLLRHRHLRCDSFDSHALLRLAQRLQYDSALVTLNVHCHFLGATGAQALVMMQRYSAHRNDAIHGMTVKLQSISKCSSGDFGATAVSLLCHAPALRCLCVTLWGNDLGDDGMRTLAALATSPSLEVLNLNLWCNRIGNAGAQALSSLKDCPRLQTLALGLGDNQVRVEGARALALLRQSATLRNLSLVLSVNSLSDGGAYALAELQHLPGLQSLTLDLGDNGIGDSGAHSLSTLHFCATLRTLSLTLWCNSIGDPGAWSLAALRLAPRLEDLHLNLRMNRIRAEGATALAMLGRSSTLSRLFLDLSSNGVGDRGAAALVALGQSPQLTSLELRLAGTGLTDDAARALASLYRMPQLRSLALGLAGNNIGDDGAAALKQLRESCGLRTLNLDLTDNSLTHCGVHTLQDLASTSTPLLDVTLLAPAAAGSKRCGRRSFGHRARLLRPTLLDLWNRLADRFIARYQSYPEYILASYHTP